MTSIRFTGIRTFAVAWIATFVAACATNPTTSATPMSGTALLYMQRDTSSSRPAPAPDSATGTSRAVDQDSVQYLKVTVIGIDYLPAGAADTSDSSASWIRADLASAFDLDLMALPTDSAAGQLVASTGVAAGTYAAVRLQVTNPRIAFKGSVSFGAAGTLQGGTEYAVTVPSGSRAGLKASVGVTVKANGSTNVGLTFASARTLSNITVTGTGALVLSPVIRAR